MATIQSSSSSHCHRCYLFSFCHRLPSSSSPHLDPPLSPSHRAIAGHAPVSSTHDHHLPRAIATVFLLGCVLLYRRSCSRCHLTSSLLIFPPSLVLPSQASTHTHHHHRRPSSHHCFLDLPMPLLILSLRCRLVTAPPYSKFPSPP